MSNPLIRSFAAVFVFAVFAFSITPKKWLHDAVATHQDGRQGKAVPVSAKAQWSRVTINCPCDNFIAESPFVHYETIDPVPTPDVYAIYQCIPGTVFISTDSFCFGLRGPPAQHC